MGETLAQGRSNERVLQRFLGEPGVRVVYATDATAHHCTALYRQFRQQGTHVWKEAEHAASERARAYYEDRDPGRVKDISAFHERAKYEGGPQTRGNLGKFSAPPMRGQRRRRIAYRPFCLCVFWLAQR